MPPKASTSTALSLPGFIQELVAAGLTGAEAMAAAKPLWLNDVKTKDALKSLTAYKLEHAGIDDPAVTKKLLAFAARKGKATKRKRGSDMDHPLPSEAPKPVVKQSLEFDENLEEFYLGTRSVLVNRAPVMTAWATVVAERLGFRREEALSIAQAYTEMNANAKGQSLGIIGPSRDNLAGSSQPFVELMGRKVPVLSLQNEEWRGIVKGAVAEPETAFNYIRRSMQQQAGSVMGAMRLLANSFAPPELNEKGYGMYCEFRPQSSGWGEKSELKLSAILELRRHLMYPADDAKPIVKVGEADVKAEQHAPTLDDFDESPPKRVKEDPDADEFDALDDDIDYAALDVP